MKVSIIVPCFNEEENVQTFREELLPYIKNYDFELILVDDHSLDDTYRELLKLKRKNVVVLRHKKNMGMGGAVKTGINAATGDVLITIDADLTFHPRFIKDLIDKYKETNADCVIGSHVLGKLSEDIPLYRSIISKISNRVYALLLGKKISAITPIFRLYKKNVLKNIEIKSNDFNINAEILFKLIQNKKSIAEVPVTLGVRRFGYSKLNYKKEIINHGQLALKILLWRVESLIRFTISSGLGVLVNISLTYILTEFVFGRNQYLFAYIIGLGVGILTQFIMHVIFTFKTKDYVVKKFLLFYIYSILMTIFQVFVVKNITNIVGVDYYMPVIIGTIGVFYAVSYFVNKLYIFKN